MKSGSILAASIAALLIATTAHAQFASEVEPNDSIATAQDVSAYFGLADYQNVGNSTFNTSLRVPYVSIYGTGDGTLDFYQFTATAGQRIVLDIDYAGNTFDSYIELSMNGTPLAANDDSYILTLGQEGSTSISDSYLEYTAQATGTYVVQVAACCPGTIPSGADYELQISVGDPSVPVSLTGEYVPAEPVGAKFYSFGPPATNAEGSFAVLAKLYSGYGGVTAANDMAIYAGLKPRKGNSGSGSGSGSGSTSGSGSGSAGSSGSSTFGNTIGLIAREGSQAPGVPAGVAFKTFGDPLFSDDGATAFRATLAGSGVTTANDTGIWSNTSGFLSLIAREGDEAPGAQRAIFSLFNTFSVSAAPGGTAFLAKLKAGIGGVTLANDTGIWATNLDGELVLVARKGGTIVVEGVPKQIVSLAIFRASAGATAQSRSVGAQGTLTYMVRFDDRTSGTFAWAP